MHVRLINNNITHSFLLIFFLLLFSILFLKTTTAEEDKVYFHTPANSSTPIDYVLVGEEQIDLKIVFGNNCTNWSVELNSLLFNTILEGIHFQNKSIGKTNDFSLQINQNAIPNNYLIEIYFNYTLLDGQISSKIFKITLHYFKSLEICEIHLPTLKDMRFFIIIHTYISFSQIKIEFDADGDISVDPTIIELSHPEPGLYTLQTNISRLKNSDGDSQEVGYQIIGEYQGRDIQLGASNININVDWNQQLTIKKSEDIFWIAIVSLTICITIVYIRFFYHNN